MKEPHDVCGNAEYIKELPAPEAPAPYPGSGDWCGYGPESIPIDVPTVAPEPNEVDEGTDLDGLVVGEGPTEVSEDTRNTEERETP